MLGFQHRMGQAPGDDEQFGWSEYLLYNKTRGFCFLVDAEDGWSLVAPTTGAPSMAPERPERQLPRQALPAAVRLQRRDQLRGGRVLLAGRARAEELAPRLRRCGAALLSLERAAGEQTWSTGSKIDSAAVASAFKLDANQQLFKRADAQPLSGARRLGCGTIILIVLLIIVLLLILSTCSSGTGGGR